MLPRRSKPHLARGRAATIGRVGRTLAGVGILAVAIVIGSRGTQDAIANGDTRTLEIYRDQTKESGTITFRRNGQYDPEALKQLNWLARDWHTDEQVRMDPRLFDIVWQVYREVGSREPIHVVSGYRSPETNAALRRRSRAVAEFSQHMLGKAMDFYLTDVSMARVREVGMRIQNGGVGFYPNAFNPFVHLDAGSVRSWPRMSGAELARLFPDGRTVHLPRQGKPLPGYEEAKAMILARGGTVAGITTAEAEDESGPRKSLWAMLFGGGQDEDADYYRSAAGRRPAASGAAASGSRVAAYAPSRESEDAGTRGVPVAPGRTRVASADAPPPGLERFGGRPGQPTADATAGVAADPPPARVVPVPPRRPADVTAAPKPAPSLPVTLASAGSLAALQGRGEMRVAPPPDEPATPRPVADPGPDDRAALRSLFLAVATQVSPTRPQAVATSRATLRPLDEVAAVLGDPGSRVRIVFSSALGAPDAEAFSGPAVAPLPVLR